MKRTIIGRLAVLALAAFVLASCAIETTSIEDRIAAFLNDLNNDADRNDIWENLHDDIDNAWKSSTPWETSAFAYANAPFALTAMSYGDNFAQGTINYGGVLSDTIYFAMKEEEDDDWYIYRIDIGGVQVIP